MQTLVLAGDWLLFLAAWELIGLASYLLIGFWFERPGVAASATRAFATTRAADVGLYLGVFSITWAAGTTDIAATLRLDGAVPALAGLAFLIAAAGKSAQAPLQGWLMDAMAGPTPVSALLHSATLVVAGVVLMLRADAVLVPEARLVVGVVGGVTAVVAGLTAVAQPDLKRLLAASTSSQVGLMLVAIAAGSPAAAIVHLVASAAMKGALFLGAGIFQHERNSTSLRDLGGVGREHRRVFAAMAVAGLALAGVPPLAGFWSKDAIIGATLEAPMSRFLALAALVATLLTGVYVSRMLRVLWTGGSNRGDAPTPRSGASDVMIGSLIVLVALAAGFGLALPPLVRLLGAHLPESGVAAVLGLAVSAVGLGLGWFLRAARLLGPLTGPARVGFRVDGGLDSLVIRPALSLGAALGRFDGSLHLGVLGVGNRALRIAAFSYLVDRRLHGTVLAVGQSALVLAAASRVVDEDVIDRFIANFVEATRRLGARARRLQTGLVHRELLAAAVGTAILVVLLLI